MNARQAHLQQKVEQYYSDVAERTSDTLSNVAVVQSFARVELEVSSLRKVGDLLLSAQMPVLSWWAAAAVLTRFDDRARHYEVAVYKNRGAHQP